MKKAKIKVLNLDKNNGWRRICPEIIGWEGIAEYEATINGGAWFFLIIHKKDNKDNFPLNTLSYMHIHKAQIKIIEKLREEKDA